MEPLGVSDLLDIRKGVRRAANRLAGNASKSREHNP